MSEMKGQDKTPEKQLNEVEIGSLPEKEFRIMIVIVFSRITGKQWRKCKNTKEQTDEKYTRRNQQQNKAEEWINDLEDRTVEITAVEQNIEKRNEDIVRDLRDNIIQPTFAL